jgi:hypothetical protein
MRWFDEVHTESFHNCLKSNQHVPHPYRQHLQQCLNDALRVKDAEFSSMEEFQVFHNGYELETYISHFMKALAPVRMLPFDVLLKIFVTYVDDEIEECLNGTRKIYLGPWSLGKVCTLWRWLATSTSCLWKHFDIPRNANPASQGTLALMQTSLLRGGASSFTLQVTLGGLIVSELEHHLPYLDLLVKYSPR